MRLGDVSSGGAVLAEAIATPCQGDPSGAAPAEEVQGVVSSSQVQADDVAEGTARLPALLRRGGEEGATE